MMQLRRVIKKLRGEHQQESNRFYIIHVDESGTPGIAKGRHYILFGLATPLNASIKVMELGEEILLKLKEDGYQSSEIKGSEVYKLLKKEGEEGIDKYIQLIKSAVDSLAELESFSIAVVIDKKLFKEKAFSRLRDHLFSALAEPPVGYLNVLSVPLVRKKIIDTIVDRQGDLIVRAQSINELLVRVQKTLESMSAYGIVIFDSEANTLASSAYGIFAGALRREGLAYVKGGLGRPDRILHVSLSKSSLDYGIQLADLLVNALYNCIEHNITGAYKHLSVLLSEKGLAILPKEASICM